MLNQSVSETKKTKISEMIVTPRLNLTEETMNKFIEIVEKMGWNWVISIVIEGEKLLDT